MGAASFGYGIFQLTVSLLPPNLIKFISFLGFGGNRDVGLSCLMYSENSDDIRAPFAILSLLWYYTIGIQLFHISHGKMENEIEMTKQILKDCQQKYATSAIFLFFRGSLKRLECNIDEAIQFYDAAYRMSAQKECVGEPSVGLAFLILGSSSGHTRNFAEAMKYYRLCIKQRENITEDIHISAFAHYDLAMLLKMDETESSKNEARAILQNAILFKNYDFETLSVNECNQRLGHCNNANYHLLKFVK